MNYSFHFLRFVVVINENDRKAGKVCEIFTWFIADRDTGFRQESILRRSFLWNAIDESIENQPALLAFKDKTKR